MGVSDDSVRGMIETFRAAAMGQADWWSAMEQLAAVTGSMGGQLIGLGRDAAVPFNLMTGCAPETAAEFFAAGGGDTRVNSRVRRGSVIGELVVLDEADFTTAEDMARNPEYAEWIRRHDMHNACLTPLVKGPDLLVGLCVLRTEKQGNVSAEEKRAFAELAAHARAAVRTQMALQDHSLALLTEAFEAIRATVFLCGGDGRVRAMTPSAEALASAGDGLTVREGRLAPAAPADRSALDEAIRRAAAGLIDPGPPLALARPPGDDALLVEVAPAPRRQPLGFNVAVLVIVRDFSPNAARIAQAARALYGLTDAEAAVAAQLALGRAAAAIAYDRGVALGTVRFQVRRILEKTGAGSQLELAALLARL